MTHLEKWDKKKTKIKSLKTTWQFIQKMDHWSVCVWVKQQQNNSSDITQLPSEQLYAKSLCTLPLWFLFSDRRALWQAWPPLLLALAYEVSSYTTEKKKKILNEWDQFLNHRFDEIVQWHTPTTFSFWLGSCKPSLRDFGLLDSPLGDRLETVAVSFE